MAENSFFPSAAAFCCSLYFCLCLHAANGCCCCCLLLPFTVPAYYSNAACCCQLHAAALYPMHATTITLESLCITNHPPSPLFTQQALFRPNLAIRQSRLNHKTKGPTSWELQRKRKRWFPTQLFPPHQGKTKGLRAIVLADFHCTSHVDSLVACHN